MRLTPARMMAVGDATYLAFTVQPTANLINTSIYPAIKVLGYPRNISGTITLSLSPGSGATLSGTLSVSVVDGVATFSDISIDTAGTSYTLVATATGTTSATSSAFNIYSQYSATGSQTFDSGAVSMRGIPADDSSSATSMRVYDDTTMVLWDYANPTNLLYRVNINTGAVVTQAATGDASAPLAVTHTGDVIYQKNTYDRIYKIATDGTIDYIASSYTAGGVVFVGVIQYPIVGGTDLVTYSRSFTSIDWAAHTATEGAGCASPAKQNANIAAGRVYCNYNGYLGYFNTTTKAIVSLTALPANTQSDTMIVDANQNMYFIDLVPKVYKYNSAGVLQATSIQLPVTESGQTARIACYTDDGYLWVWANSNQSPIGMQWWKLDVSDLSVAATGTVARHHTTLTWVMACGSRFSDQTSPILMTSNSGAFYIGKMVME